MEGPPTFEYNRHPKVPYDAVSITTVIQPRIQDVHSASTHPIIRIPISMNLTARQRAWAPRNRGILWPDALQCCLWLLSLRGRTVRLRAPNAARAAYAATYSILSVQFDLIEGN